MKPLSASSIPAQLPQMKLFQVPSLSFRKTMALVVVYYTLLISGVVYDMISSPPAYDVDQSDSGNYRIVIFRNGVSSQYIIEGLAFGIVCATAGLSLILLEFVNASKAGVSREGDDKGKFLVSVICLVYSFISMGLIYVFGTIKLKN